MPKNDVMRFPIRAAFGVFSRSGGLTLKPVARYVYRRLFTRPKVMPFRAIQLVGILTGLTLLSGSVWAQDVGAVDEPVAKQVESLAEEASRFVEEGKIELAIARYLEAYRLAPTATLLYNIAYIYDYKMGETELAIEHYRRYLSAHDAEPSVVQLAVGRIRELTKKPGQVPNIQPENSAKTIAPVQPLLEPSPTAVEGDVAATTTISDEISSTRIAGYVVGGVGVALLLSGAATGFMAMDTHHAYLAAVTAQNEAVLRDRGKTQVLATDILLATGTLSAITGLILVFLEKDEDDQPQEAWAPIFAPDESGWMMGVDGRF
jgi:tetratricopeptide (TPR) repeat protein